MATAPAAPLIPLQPQNEEKTLVYVLVRHPDEVDEPVVPTVVPTQPNKPEVYFIRYKTKKESSAASSSADSSSGPYPDRIVSSPSTKYGV